MKVKSIHFKKQHGFDERIAIRSEPGKYSKIFLSPLTIEVLNAALENRISIVFAQGPLRLSPLLSGILTLEQKNDVLLGIPRNQFNDLISDYESSFLSLYDESGGFFYENVLWCTADVDSGNIGFIIKNVATRPKWGRRNYKNKFDVMLTNCLVDGSCRNWPRILCIPVDNVLPNNLLGNTTFTFRRHRYELAPFTPKFIILEAVNERVFSAEPVIALLKSMAHRSIGGVIHFSWPYVPSVGKLLGCISEVEKETGRPLTVIHMGKRYCIEMKDAFNDYVTKLDGLPTSKIDCLLKDHPGFKEFSIEGKSWTDYYPDLSKIDLMNHLTLGIIDYDRRIGFKMLADLEGAEGPFDNLLEETSSAAYEYEESGRKVPWRSMILLPPFVDSFLLPKETKVFCESQNGEYRALPIKEAIQNRMGESAPVLGSYASLCSQMDSVADFLHIVRGISTYTAIGKSTALLCYLYNTVRDWRKPDECLVICNFSSNVGFRKGMMQRIVGLLGTLQQNPELSSKTIQLDDFFKSFVPGGGRKELPIGDGILKSLEYRLDSSGRDLEVNLTYACETDSRRSVTSVKKIRILIINFDQINSVSSLIETRNAILLLPGPIPVFSFRDETPVITKGFDGLLRPFRNIIMFAFAGENLRRCLEQINIIDELMGSDASSPISQIDLSLSTRHMPKKLIVGIENPTVETNAELEELIREPEESPLDVAILKRILSEEKKTTRIRARTLQEAWDSIADRRPAIAPHQPSYPPSMTEISFEVRFVKDERVERISLNPLSYVRVIGVEGADLCLAKNLVPGQKIAYLKSDTKESLDNFFIRNFSESRGWTLEEVFEPFTCLSLFYEALTEADFSDGYIEEQFSKLYWLTPSRRNSLFTIVKFLLEEYFGSVDQLLSDWKRLISDLGVWSSLTSLNQNELWVLKKAFHETSLITPDKLHLVATTMGMIYDPSSFKLTINRVTSGEKRYYFQNPQNLLAIGKLLGHNRIIERYEEITSAGKAIRIVLELEGFAISRVIAGKENPLSDMDTIIKERMFVCEIMRRVD